MRRIEKLVDVVAAMRQNPEYREMDMRQLAELGNFLIDCCEQAQTRELSRADITPDEVVDRGGSVVSSAEVVA